MSKTKPKIGLLRKWAKLLRTKKVAKHFDISKWLSGDSLSKPGDCRTIACAAGWLATIPESQIQIMGNYVIHLNGRTGHGAVQAATGLMLEDVYDICDPCAYVNSPKPTEVAARIDRLAKQRKR